MAAKLTACLTAALPLERPSGVHALQHHGDDPSQSSTSGVPGDFRIFATGWQKSGSTAMTVALGSGLGVRYVTEAVEGCCCAGHSCNGDAAPAATVATPTCDCDGRSA